MSHGLPDYNILQNKFASQSTLQKPANAIANAISTETRPSSRTAIISIPSDIIRRTADLLIASSLRQTRALDSADAKERRAAGRVARRRRGRTSCQGKGCCGRTRCGGAVAHSAGERDTKKRESRAISRTQRIPRALKASCLKSPCAAAWRTKPERERYRVCRGASGHEARRRRHRRRRRGELAVPDTSASSSSAGEARRALLIHMLSGAGLHLGLFRLASQRSVASLFSFFARRGMYIVSSLALAP